MTPINDSFLDFDVLATIDATTYSVTGESHYAKMVRDFRRKRRQLDGASTDWIVVRNRLSVLNSRNQARLASGLKELSLSDWAFVRSMVLPNARSIASSFRVA